MPTAPPDLTTFTPKGPVGDGKLYIERPADRQLPALLAQGEYCYVFGPRQLGKTSLRLHAARQLATKGVRCVHVDLTQIGTDSVLLENWCYTFATMVARDLDLHDWEDRWGSETHLTSIARWLRFLRVEVLDTLSEPVVLFVDEIDVMLRHKFRDDIFAAIRALYHDRIKDSAYERLTFCLIGVVMPQDLASDPTRTPFNIGREVALRDFTEQEASAFAAGFPQSSVPSEQLVAEVLHWTSGHPAMTQQLCVQLVAQPAESTATAKERVKDLVTELFLSRGLTADPILNDIAIRFKQHHAVKETRPLLLLYYRLLSDERVKLDSKDDLHQRLQLIGMASERPGSAGSAGTPYLTVRNRILAAVLNKDWTKSQIEAHKLTAQWLLWQDSGYKDANLLREPELSHARKWAAEQTALTTEERKILQVSEEREQSRAHSQRRDLRRMLNASGLVSLVILIAFLSAFSLSRREARELQKRISTQETTIKHLEQTLRELSRLEIGAEQSQSLNLELICSQQPLERERLIAKHIQEVKNRQKELTQLSQQVERISTILKDSQSRTERAKSKLDSGMVTLLLGDLKEARSEINELDRQLRSASSTSDSLRQQLTRLTPQTATAAKSPAPATPTPLEIEPAPPRGPRESPDRLSKGVDSDLLKAETLCVEEQYSDGIQLARTVLSKKLNVQNKQIAWRIIGSCACRVNQIAAINGALRRTNKMYRKVIIAACEQAKIMVSCRHSSCTVK